MGRTRTAPAQPPDPPAAEVDRQPADPGPAPVELPDELIDEAPNLRGRYPLGGERLGPAWREAWRVLGTGEWVSVRTLCFDVAPRHGLSPQALDTVVRTARSLPRNHPGRLESVRGDDNLIAVRRADLPEPSAPGEAGRALEVPAAALNGMFVGALAPVAVTHADGAPMPEDAP